MIEQLLSMTDSLDWRVAAYLGTRRTIALHMTIFHYDNSDHQSSAVLKVLHKVSLLDKATLNLVFVMAFLAVNQA
jgi:hypothetical protein